MHQIVALGLPHAPQGKLYLEDAGRVLHIFSDLRSDQSAEIRALVTALEPRIGAQQDFDEVVIHLEDGQLAHRT